MNKAKQYPDNWDEIAFRIKEKNQWRCERCWHGHNPAQGYCLTVHHLDGNTNNNEEWNLACLCQRCHLKMQARIKMDQMFWDAIYPVSKWFEPHLNGYLESLKKKKLIGKHSSENLTLSAKKGEKN